MLEVRLLSDFQTACCHTIDKPGPPRYPRSTLLMISPSVSFAKIDLKQEFILKLSLSQYVCAKCCTSKLLVNNSFTVDSIQIPLGKKFTVYHLRISIVRISALFAPLSATIIHSQSLGMLPVQISRPKAVIKDNRLRLRYLNRQHS